MEISKFICTNACKSDGSSRNFCIVCCRKAEIEVLFDKSSSGSDGDNLNSKSTSEAQVMVRAA